MIDLNDSSLTPKTEQSNLNVKKNQRRRKNASEKTKERKKIEENIAKDADVIFGLDNGATGTISCIIRYPDKKIDVFFNKTFAKIENDYQKDQQKIARIDWMPLHDWFKDIIAKATRKFKKAYDVSSPKIAIVMERPMINADRFKQSKNAARAFEATLIVIEMLGLKENYIIIDSKKWQHHFFGKNTALIDLKEASKNLRAYIYE